MKLYIVRHAIAEKRGKKFYENDDRPLTKAGINKMMKNAEGIAKIITNSVIIVSSPLKRAFATAEILSSKLHQTSSVTFSNDLSPDTSVERIIGLCKKYSTNKAVMIIGHEPSLGKFISTILQHKIQSLKLKKGSLCCIEFDQGFPEQSELLFYLPPRILRTVS